MSIRSKAAFTVLCICLSICSIHASGHSIERGRKLLRKGGLGFGQATANSAATLQEVADLGSATTVSCTTTPAAYIASNPDLSIFYSALQSLGMSTTLNSYYSEYTIFAPTNDAFTSLLNAKGTTLEALQTNDPATLKLILNNHIIPGSALTVADFTVGSLYATMNNGENIKLASALDPIIVQGDIDTCASVIHTINIVLVPDSVSIAAGTAAQQQGTTGTTSSTAGGASLDVTKVDVNGNNNGGSFSSASGSFGGGSFDFSAINISG